MINKIIISRSDIAGDLGGIKNDLFPSWPTIIALVAAILILMVVLTIFLYNPIKRLHEGRAEFIKQNIKKASEDQYKADQNILEAKVGIKNVNEEAASIIANAKRIAESTRQEMLDVAKKDVEVFLDETSKRMALEKEVESQRTKEEAAGLALEMAAKLLNKDLNSKDNIEFVKKLLEQ